MKTGRCPACGGTKGYKYVARATRRCAWGVDGFLKESEPLIPKDVKCSECDHRVSLVNAQAALEDDEDFIKPIATKDMTILDAVRDLEKHGSDNDPINYRGDEITPQDLLARLDDRTLAGGIRINYWGKQSARKKDGTLSGMVTDRRKL